MSCSVRGWSCKTVETGRRSGFCEGLTSSESKIPNSQERITWLKRYGSDELRARSIASRTRAVLVTLIPAKIMWTPPIRNCRRNFLSIFKPLAERLDLFLRIGREQVVDCDVRRRDENRFRVRESVKTGLTVVMADAPESDASERHAFNEQMKVHLVDPATSEGQAREEVVDRLLVTAEKETGEGFWMLLPLTNGGIRGFIRKDWEDRPKDFVLHDRVVPRDRIQDRGIEVARFAVGRASGHNLALIN